EGDVRPGSLRRALIHRRAESRHLRLLDDVTTSGRVQMVRVSGPSGIGKTTLLDLAAASVRAGDGEVAWLGGAGAGPWDALVAQLDVAVGGPEASPVPHLVVVDDLHLCDGAEVDRLRGIVQGAIGRSGPVLMVVSYLDDPDIPPVAAIENLPGPVVRLGALDLEELSALVRHEIGGPVLRQELLAIRDATGGVPRYVEEVLASTGGRGPWTELPVAAGARVRIEERLARLDPPHRRLLGRAAVLGDTVDAVLVAESTATGIVAVLQALDAAREMRLVEDRGPGAYAFADRTVRRLLLERVPPGVAATTHRLAAAVVVERVRRNAAAPSFVVHHLLADPEPPVEDLVHWTVLAVDHHLRAGEADEAVQLCATVSARAGRATAEHQARLHAARARALSADLAYQPPADDVARAVRAAGDVGSARLDVDVLAAAATAFAPGAPVPPSLAAELSALAARVFDEAPDDCDRAACVRALALSSSAPPDRVRSLAERAELLAEARAAAHRAGDPLLRAEALHACRDLALARGDRAGADDAGAALVDLASRTRLARVQWMAAVALQSAALLDGRFVVAQRMAATGARARWASAATQPARAATAFEVARHLGGMDRCEGPIRAAVEREPHRAVWRAMAALVALDSGARQEAVTALDRFAIEQRAVPASQGDDHLVAAALFAEVAVALGDTEVAAELAVVLQGCEVAMVVLPGGVVHRPLACVQAQLAALLGDPASAGTRFEAGVFAAAGLGSGPLVAEARADHAAFLGAAGDRDQAEVLARRALDAAGHHGVVTLESRLKDLLAGFGGPVAGGDGEPAGSGGGDPSDGFGAGLAGGGPVAAPARPRSAVDAPGASPPDGPSVRVRCLGGYDLVMGGRRMETGSIRPKVLTLLWVLSVNPGVTLHDEHLVDLLWPEADLASGRRRLQVAMSSLRRAAEEVGGAVGRSAIARHGSGYRLDLGGGRCDLVELEDGVRRAREQRRAGRESEACAAYEWALHWYRGELLPEAGPVEWVVRRRDEVRALVGDAALELAEMHLDLGDIGAALRACERGLHADAYRDDLWRTLVRASELDGDVARAQRAQARYEAVLGELGLSGT
ncbi:MAG: BTAD domain-containing putative transcriptional regulator, partial [Acidimicrobiia bacterium]